MSDESDFIEKCTRYLKAKLASQETCGIKERVPKASIQLIMARRGYGTAHVDRKWKRSKNPRYARYYDPAFPKPIDEHAFYLEWWLDELIAYRDWKYGKRVA